MAISNIIQNMFKLRVTLFWLSSFLVIGPNTVFGEGSDVIVNTAGGTVNYETGEVNISDFDPEDGQIGIIAVPESFDVNVSGNYLLQISTGDSTVRAIDKDDTASLNLFNVSRAS